jgi:prepilin-type processing-associated H-X9-DG protein
MQPGQTSTDGSARDGPRTTSRQRAAIISLVLILIIISGACIAFHRFSEYAGRKYCAGNMREIALAAIMYANAHNQRLPDNFLSLYNASNTIPVGALFCPNIGWDQKSTATVNRTRDVIANDRISYIWIGKGVTADSPTDVVILYEKPDNHDGYGMNIAFADAHIEWLSPEDAKAFLAKVASADRPIHFHAMHSASTQP